MFRPRRLFALAATAIACVSAGRYYDVDTGLNFSESVVALSLVNNMVFRVALPDTAQSFTPYDVVIQVVAPNLGWTGVAWGAQMLRNPLTVFWASNNQVVVSNRYASGRTAAPPVYSGAVLEVFPGSIANRTHLQFTALCRGCTWYPDANGVTRYVSTTSSAVRFAWAGTFTPVNSASNNANFPIHTSHNIFTSDFSISKNSNWEDILIRNLGHA